LRLAILVVGAALAPLAHAQSDPAKVLRVVFRTAETGFDPQAVSDLYSNYVNRAIFEPPFRYDFRARPHKVVPNTTVALPEGNKDGTEWTIRVKPGIYFTDDPAFKGKKRELTGRRLRVHVQAHARPLRCARRRSSSSTAASWEWTRC
jgi:ABC-type transport system substrate-binding protein